MLLTPGLEVGASSWQQGPAVHLMLLTPGLEVSAGPPLQVVLTRAPESEPIAVPRSWVGEHTANRERTGAYISLLTSGWFCLARLARKADLFCWA